jgi:hypothetical protein
MQLKKFEYRFSLGGKGQGVGFCFSVFLNQKRVNQVAAVREAKEFIEKHIGDSHEPLGLIAGHYKEPEGEIAPNFYFYPNDLKIEHIEDICDHGPVKT